MGPRLLGSTTTWPGLGSGCEVPLGLSGCEFRDRVFRVMNYRVFRVSYCQVVNLFIESGGLQAAGQLSHDLVWAQAVKC